MPLYPVKIRKNHPEKEVGHPIKIEDLVVFWFEIAREMTHNIEDLLRGT